jgi:hypothetical protein
MRKFVLFIFFFGSALYSFATEKRDLLQKEAQRINIAQSLVKNFSELDFPKYRNRGFWNNLPSAIREKYIKDAENVLNYNWPAIKATDYLEVVRSGDRRDEVYNAPRSVLTALIMGELAEGKGRFIDQIVNGVWFYSEQTWWGWSAHFYLQKASPGLPDANEPTIDLGVGEMANILSWTWFLFKDEFDKIHPLIAKRLKSEIMKKAVIPYYERNDFWWQGLDGSRSVNNWNPWTNYNILTAILILEDNPAKKIAGVEKVVKSLDQFVNGYPDDGGCDEGPSYWGRAGASLFQCLDLLKRATGSKFNVFDNHLIKSIGSYIYKVYIEYPYFINFADADAITGSRPCIIFEYGKATGDSLMQKFGAYLAQKQNWGQKIPDGKVDEQISQLMQIKEIEDFHAEDVLISDFWLPNIEVAGGRDNAGMSKGFFFAAKGGNNAESHNHNDVGSCIVYYNGKPCIIDIGREKYTAKTFSSNRYDIWTMQSQYHNLPKINGIDQRNGREYNASSVSCDFNKNQATFSADIASAYPKEAGVKKWVRTYELHRGKRFTIKDQYELAEITDTTSINFILYCDVREVKPGIIQLSGDNYKMEMKYNPNILLPKVEFYNVTDSSLQRFWPNGVTRIVFTMNVSKKKGENIISLNPLSEK